MPYNQDQELQNVEILGRLIELLNLTIECESFNLAELLANVAILKNVVYERLLTPERLQEMYAQFESPRLE